MGTIKHEITAEKVVAVGLTCTDMSSSVSATNTDEARGELNASGKETFGTKERCLLNSSLGAIGQEGLKRSKRLFDRPAHNVVEGDVSLGCYQER